ncbi:MAG: hypothetical protein HRU17_10610 [Polyangiaceae bacterium]|nr:hypothetical protein [Polyangiaceae bacterium]
MPSDPVHSSAPSLPVQDCDLQSHSLSGTEWLSLGAPAECRNNPCNPYCQSYLEAVDGGWGPTLVDSAVACEAGACDGGDACAEAGGAEAGCISVTQQSQEYREDYFADCSSSRVPSAIPVWVSLRYNTTIASGIDASIRFWVRGGEGPLPLSGPWLLAMDTPVATATGESPDCSGQCVVDLGSLIGAQEFLELRVEVLPGSKGRTDVRLDDWEIQYSCAPLPL